MNFTHKSEVRCVTLSSPIKSSRNSRFSKKCQKIPPTTGNKSKFTMKTDMNDSGDASQKAESIPHGEIIDHGVKQTTRRQFMKTGGTAFATLITWNSLVETSKAVDESSAEYWAFGSVSFS